MSEKHEDAANKKAAQNPFDFTAITDAIIKAVDLNGDGQIGIEDFIIFGLRTPGVHINRSEFLRNEFIKEYPAEVITKAINENPMSAGIDSAYIDKLAGEVINFERLQVSGISTALGMPGGMAMLATIPTDLAQYYGYLLRAMQKLLYLYGFPEINVEEHGQVLDSATMSTLVICMGVMHGVQAANKVLIALANGIADKVSKYVLRTALTKGTLYPLIKKISAWFGVRMTKQLLSQFAKKAIPIVGGVVGGGITFLSFGPCCDRLKATLRDTKLSNPNYKATAEVTAIAICENTVE